MKELIIKIINEVIKENFIIVSNKGSLGLSHNKKIFKKYKLLYKDIFKPSEYLYIFKNKNNVNKLLNEMFCICGNKNKFINQLHGYHKHCCYKCRSNDEEVNKKKKLTYLKNWGVDNNFKSKIFQKQSKLIKKLKYNDENYNNRNKAKQTCLNKYGVDNPNKCKKIREKIENTCMQHYNVKHNWSSKDPKLNGEETRLKLYGAKNFYASQQFKDKYKNEIWCYNRQQKRQQTCFKKYGVNYFSKTSDFKTKIYQTKKKNNSFNKSIQEEQVYNYLLQKFNKDDIERQYKSNLYPFNCDFYIKSLDLYIEYHGTWTHHNKPFKNSIEDLEELKRLKNKNSKYYDVAVYVWSDLDVRKLQTFKNNKLRYKIFYNINQFKNWFNKINL